MLGDLSGSELIKSIGQIFPVSLPTIKGLLGINGGDFKIYSMCSKCYAIYAKEDCTKTLLDGRVVSQTCSKVSWPRHPQIGRWTLCGERLIKKVRGKSGNFFWYPRKVYVYQSLMMALKKFVNNENISDKCDRWRKTCEGASTDFKDIYDRKVWKEFQTYDGKPFLKDRNNFALLLNVDWFNPYKHSPGSIGAIYCVFANFPEMKDTKGKMSFYSVLWKVNRKTRHEFSFETSRGWTFRTTGRTLVQLEITLYFCTGSVNMYSMWHSCCSKSRRLHGTQCYTWMFKMSKTVSCC